jgi:hypothetical protein
MLQIDHVYEFLYQELFKNFDLCSLPNGGVVKNQDLCISDMHVFTSGITTTKKIFFYDQEPFVESLSIPYMDMFTWMNRCPVDELLQKNINNNLPYGFSRPNQSDLQLLIDGPVECIHKQGTLVTSEKSSTVTDCLDQYNLKSLYYFFHGFAALDWYRGYYALNYSKSVIRKYTHDFVSYNRIINYDRSYRIYWVSKLKELGLLEHGAVSFNVTDNLFDDWRDEVADPNTKLSEHARQHIEQHLTDIHKLVIDNSELPGSASADIPRGVDALWHIVSETVFYYDKLHLTEKIFKPIVSKQPFMLLAAPNNLAYLKSYGFKTFEGIIDESYDLIQDHDTRINAVAAELNRLCNMTAEGKQQVVEAIAPIVEYNFHHFYGEFKHIITRELLDNTKALFKEIGYDDDAVAYEDIYKVLTN